MSMPTTEHKTRHSTEHSSAEWNQNESAIEREAVEKDPAVAFANDIEEKDSRLASFFQNPAKLLNFTQDQASSFIKSLHHAFDNRSEEFPHSDRDTAEGIAKQIFEPLHERVNDQEYYRTMNPDGGIQQEEYIGYRVTHHQLQVLEHNFAQTMETKGIEDRETALDMIYAEARHIAEHGAEDTRQARNFSIELYQYDLERAAYEHSAKDAEFDQYGARCASWTIANRYLHTSQPGLEFDPNKEPNTAEIYGQLNSSFTQGDWRNDAIKQYFPKVEAPTDFSNPDEIREFIHEAQERYQLNTRLKESLGFPVDQWQGQVIESASGWANIYNDYLDDQRQGIHERSAAHEKLAGLPGIGRAIKALEGALKPNTEFVAPDHFEQTSGYLHAYCQAMAYAANN